MHVEPDTERPVDTLNRIVIGYGLSQAVDVAAKLGIPDLLANGPRDDADLATQPTQTRRR